VSELVESSVSKECESLRWVCDFLACLLCSMFVFDVMLLLIFVGKSEYATIIQVKW